MPIVQSRNDDPVPFQIVLPEHPGAEQTALKDKIDELIEILNQKRSNTNYTEWVDALRALAVEGFDAVSPNPALAIDRAESLVGAITRADPKIQLPQYRPGAFRVALPDPANDYDKTISWREIIFNVTGELIPTPPAQLSLKADIEATLTTLQVIFRDKGGELHPKTLTLNQRRFQAYQHKLLGIAQSGLQTPADPESARKWLESLQAEILMQEGPRVKSGYMATLGLAAVISATISATIYLMVRNNPDFSKLIYSFRNFFVLWTGTMIGTWLSFGIRRAKIAFKDLGNLEEDKVEPGIRLIFTGFLAFTIAFIFICGMINVNVGGVSSDHLMTQGSSALLIGLLLGVSEQALPGTLTRRASQFVSEIGGKA
jgi:hypothetical protein